MSFYSKFLWAVCFSSLALSGCSSDDIGSAFRSVIGDGGGGGASIYGLVSKASGTSSKPILGKVGAKSTAFADAVGGCTITAYDIRTNRVVSTTTSGSDGTYHLDGLSDGTAYKIVASCSDGLNLAMVEKADEDASASSPSVTNALSTTIATYITRALIQAVESATQGMPATVQGKIKDSIMGMVDQVTDAITAAIEEAVEQEIMDPPSITQASSLASGLKDLSTDSSSLSDINSVVTGSSFEAPSGLENSFVGTANSAVILPGCDADLSGTLQKCTQATAKFLFNSLAFPIALRLTGGVFGDHNCNEASIEEHFENADFITDATDPMVPDNYCLVLPKLGMIDINNSQNAANTAAGAGGVTMDHADVPPLAETGDMSEPTDGTIEAGIVTELAKAIFNKKEYLLQDLSRFIFDSKNGAGRDIRIFKQTEDGAVIDYYYFHADGTWQLMPSTCGGTNMDKCTVWDFDFLNPYWYDLNPANNNTADLSPVVSKMAYLPNWELFYSKFGGPVPTLEQLKDDLTNVKTHMPWNPGGNRFIDVMTSEPPKMDWAGPNLCYDDDPDTQCLTQSGDPMEQAAYRLSFTVGAKETAAGDFEGFRPISTITGGSSGDFYLFPVQTANGFNGLIELTRVEDGRRALDDLFFPRTVKIVLDASECDGTKLPTAGAGCDAGIAYNVRIKWEGCTTTCPDYEIIDSTAITVSNLNINIQTEYKQDWFEKCDSGGNCWWYGLVATGTTWPLKPVTYTIGAARGDFTDITQLAGATVNLNADGPASAQNQYNLSVHWSCSGTCVQKLYLVDYEGIPVTGLTGGTSLTDTLWGPGGTTYTTVTDIGLASLPVDHDTGTGGDQSLAQIAGGMKHVYMGPVANGAWGCEGIPFFIDRNSNDTLDCIDNGSGQSVPDPTSGDIAFDWEWSYDMWKRDLEINFACTGGEPEGSECGPWDNPLVFRQNANAYKDPMKTTKLMSKAFAGWLDGEHTISRTTTFNALQGFALLYFFLSEGDGGNFKLPSLCEPTDGVNCVQHSPSNFGAIVGPGNMGGYNQPFAKGFAEFAR